MRSLSYAEISRFAGSGTPKLASILNLDNAPGYYIIDMKERDPDRVRAVVSAVIESRLHPDQVMFQSEDPATLALLDELLPASRTVYLSRLKRRFPYFNTPGPKRIIRKLRRLEVDGISLKGRSFVDKAFVDELKAAGYHVNVWTINDPSRAAFYREIGAGGIITDAVEGIRVMTSKSRVPCSWPYIPVRSEDQRMSNTRYTNTVVAALLVAIGIATAGYFIGQTMYNSKVGINTAKVKGLAERRVDADRAYWLIQYTVSGNDKNEISALYGRSEADQKRQTRWLRYS